jgi:hypothetical protein
MASQEAVNPTDAVPDQAQDPEPTDGDDDSALTTGPAVMTDLDGNNAMQVRIQRVADDGEFKRIEAEVTEGEVDPGLYQELFGDLPTQFEVNESDDHKSESESDDHKIYEVNEDGTRGRDITHEQFEMADRADQGNDEPRERPRMAEDGPTNDTEVPKARPFVKFPFSMRNPMNPLAHDDRMIYAADSQESFDSQGSRTPPLESELMHLEEEKEDAPAAEQAVPEAGPFDWGDEDFAGEPEAKKAKKE